MQVIITLLIFVALCLVLNQMSRKHIKYSNRVFTGLGLGIVFGLLIQFILGAESDVTAEIMDWIDIVGKGYINFLQMLVIPLVMVSMIRAFTKLDHNQSNLGKIGTGVIGTLLITVAIAAFIAIATGVLFNLDGAEFARGAAENARIDQLVERNSEIADLTIPETIRSFIPVNVFADMAGSRSTSTIAVVIFSVFVGAAYLGVRRHHPEEAEIFEKIINSLHTIVSRLVTLVLRIAPYGIFALMTKALATSSISTIQTMATFIVACYVALIVMFIIHMIILALFGINPIQYLKKAANVLLFAFTSRSSAGSLPLNIQTQTEALGVDTPTANFSATFGLSIGQNGCVGIYPVMLAVIAAPAAGMSFSDPSSWITIIAAATITSIGVSGAGGGATFGSLILFGMLGLPIEVIGLMVSIEPIVDMGRTALNVNDSIIAGTVTSKAMGNMNQTIFNDPEALVEPEDDVDR